MVQNQGIEYGNEKYGKITETKYPKKNRQQCICSTSVVFESRNSFKLAIDYDY